MNLLLDLGNSRLKWALTHGPGLPFVAHGSAVYAEADLEKLAAIWRNEMIDRVCYASVIGPDKEQTVLSLLPPKTRLSRFLVSAQFGTLRNGYGTPETLGIDRWAAAIGAWTKIQGACLVISAGTATTIDVIEAVQAGGLYRGGLIMPGVDLMLRALHQGTARLPEAIGRYRAAPDVPDNTDDAMVSGVIEATCGAIVRMAARLPADVPWLLTGGSAHHLDNALEQRATIVEGLVLQGLAEI
ncbi:MAG: type pantothenate kinase [Pseudomonadota bacterium]|jgi:type III pantothenate kinase